MRSESMQARPMTDDPIDLDKHRGMAAGKETDLRRALVELETKAKDLRDRQAHLENELLSVSAASWPKAAAKARYVLNCTPRDCRRRTPVIARSLKQYWRILRVSLTIVERTRCVASANEKL